MILRFFSGSALSFFLIIESRVSGSGLLANVEVGAGALSEWCAMSLLFSLLRPDSRECR